MSEPAFPIVGSAQDNQFNGMTLRDYFAAKALAAMLSNSDKEGVNRGAQGLNVFPVYAYEWADAMLDARNSAAVIPIIAAINAKEPS